MSSFNKNRNLYLLFFILLITNFIRISTIEEFDCNIKETFLDYFLEEDKKDCPLGEDRCTALGGICMPQYVCPTVISGPKHYKSINQYSCALD